MGATYFYMPEDALFVTSYWGRTEIGASEAMRAARAADPSRKEARAHIIDLSDHEGTTSSPDAESAVFRALGTVYVESFDVPTIIVATRPHIFGQARIFETTVGLQPDSPGVKVVRSWKEAEIFLGANLSGVQAEIRRRQAASAPNDGTSPESDR